MTSRLTPLTAAFVFLTAASAVAATDSGMVRIRGELSGTTITLDECQPTTRDSYGNVPGNGAWFLFRVPVGTHVLSVTGPDDRVFQETFTVTEDEVATVEVAFSGQFGPPSPTGDPGDPAWKDFSKLTISSEPDSARVRLDDNSEFTTPAVMFVMAGKHKLEASKDGFEPLVHEVSDSGNTHLSVLFVLRAVQPAPLSAEELGLDRHPTLTLKDETAADAVRKRYNGLAELFAIVPLGQGVMARIAWGEDGRREANTLIIAGVGLTTGSYLLGSILSKRKRGTIRAANKLITRQNTEAQEYNRQVEKQVRELNAAAVAEWGTHNRVRGRVDVVRESME